MTFEDYTEVIDIFDQVNDNTLPDKDIDCLIQYEGDYALCNYGMATIHLPNGYGELRIFLNQFDKSKKKYIRKKYIFKGDFSMGVFEDEKILSIPALSQSNKKEDSKLNNIQEYLCYFQYGAFVLEENAILYAIKNSNNYLKFLTRGEGLLDTIN